MTPNAAGRARGSEAFGPRCGPSAAALARARRQPVITIDGPAGAGKSTVARELAKRLGFRLVDTGAMYRALALRVREAGIPPEDGPDLRELLCRTTVELRGEQVWLEGRDVSQEIRTAEIAELTSRLTVFRSVREKVTPIQRQLAETGGAVLEGRDTGSVVCPDAEVKFYLDASEEIRSARRMRELEARGTPRSLAEVRAEIAQRDRQDRSRELAPLLIPEGAVVIDTTGRSVEQVVALLLEEVRKVWCSTSS